MAGAQAGAAYVTVTAAMDKGFSKDIEGALGDAGESGGDMLSSGLLSKVKGLAGPILAAIGVAEIAKALYDVGQQAFDAYANFEQLSGGVDKLFGDAAESVRANADVAFQTAGMSANDYMETVVGFSASLINSLGGDTVTAAAQADKAIRDMSDNANTFGNDMDSLQAAYKNFARGQFQLLDNLSLGYNGSKEGMEQLLADAEAISGVHYDISSYSDIIDAIHQIQEAQHIAGTTALEAAGTVEGAAASMKAAWTNWLTELGKSDADMAAVSQQLVDTALIYAQNAAELVGNIIINFVAALPSLLSGIGTALANALQLDEFIAQFQAGWDQMVQKNAEDLEQLKANISQSWENIKAMASEKWNAIKDTVSNVWSNIKSAVTGAVDGVRSYVSSAFESIRSTASSIWNGIKDSIGNAINGARGLVSSAIESIKSLFNFQISWPHIPLPHFGISGSPNPLDWLTQGVPQIYIDWYAKGGFVNEPTVISVAGESNKGGEFVWPSYEPYMSRYANALVDAMDRQGGNKGDVIVTGNQFYVRQESDIRAVALEINRLAQRERGARL